LSNRETAAPLVLSGLADGAFVVDGLPLARSTLVSGAGLTLRAGNIDVSLIYEWRRAQAQVRQAIQFTLGFE
jgi:hypothetical protein